MLRPDEKPLVVVLPKEMATAFKSQCAQIDRTMTDVIHCSIREFLAESAAPQREPKRQAKAEA